MNREIFIGNINSINCDYCQGVKLGEKPFTDNPKVAKSILVSSLVEINKIKHITLSESNPFNCFYGLCDEKLHELIHSLHITHKALIYFERYSEKYRDAKIENSKSKNGKITKKINDVIKFIYETDDDLINYLITTTKKLNDYDPYRPDSWRTVEYLNGILGSLENNHYTKRHVFQNLLYLINKILFGEKYNNKIITYKQIVDITNSIIDMYFGDDEKFTTKTNIDKFKSYKYDYHTLAGITLTHGKK